MNVLTATPSKDNDHLLAAQKGHDTGCFTSGSTVRCCSGIALRPGPGIMSHNGCCIEPCNTRLFHAFQA
ncbi:hypothetical protein E4T43_05790 [Aureobasidium subglaciale]|nr:hypothetical protein E4T43_05790 [Aureobasidium subglaciale]